MPAMQVSGVIASDGQVGTQSHIWCVQIDVMDLRLLKALTSEEPGGEARNFPHFWGDMKRDGSISRSCMSRDGSSV